MECYLGIDVGAASAKLAVVGRDGGLIDSVYLRTGGQPAAAIGHGLAEMAGRLPPQARVCGSGTTGSARHLAAALAGADIVKNEITCHAVAAVHCLPDVSTVIDIGGQDSKLIIIRRGQVVDFAMNTVCAAGTGSFLDQQAQRLAVGIEGLGPLALASKRPVTISGRCAVFAESDMIHKQQSGHRTEDIVYGLCLALVRNYLADVGPGKELVPPVLFVGGVAFNQGMVRAFHETLGVAVTVPHHHEVVGAMGAALLAQERVAASGDGSRFRGFAVASSRFQSSSFECRACPARCQVSQLFQDGRVLARWGGLCRIWEESTSQVGVT